MDTGFPLLRRTAELRSNGDAEKVVIRYLTDEIVLEGPAARLLQRMRPHLDGQTSVGVIAERVEERAERVRQLTEKLHSAGVIAYRTTEDDHRRTGGEEFYALHRRLCSEWLRPVYDHPLWRKIVDGQASRALVIGFAFEKYHYIEGAYEHMAIAAANATSEMMPHLARHFIEEYTHGDIYRKGLRSLFPDEVVLGAQPLPSTRALVNFLSESAARNSFGYYAGNELLQMTENTGDASAGRAVDEFYEAMRRHYPWSKRLIDSFIAHTHADQKLGHDSVFLEMCRSVPPLGRREVQDALNVTRSMAEHLRLFMDGIDVFYTQFPSVPRTPCTIRSE